MCFCNLNIGLILLYGIMKLYVYGVNNLNTPFNVTYTEGG